MESKNSDLLSDSALVIRMINAEPARLTEKGKSAIADSNMVNCCALFRLDTITNCHDDDKYSCDDYFTCPRKLERLNITYGDYQDLCDRRVRRQIRGKRGHQVQMELNRQKIIALARDRQLTVKCVEEDLKHIQRLQNLHRNGEVAIHIQGDLSLELKTSKLGYHVSQLKWLFWEFGFKLSEKPTAQKASQMIERVKEYDLFVDGIMMRFTHIIWKMILDANKNESADNPSNDLVCKLIAWMHDFNRRSYFDVDQAGKIFQITYFAGRDKCKVYDPTLLGFSGYMETVPIDAPFVSDEVFLSIFSTIVICVDRDEKNPFIRECGSLQRCTECAIVTAGDRVGSQRSGPFHYVYACCLPSGADFKCVPSANEHFRRLAQYIYCEHQGGSMSDEELIDLSRIRYRKAEIFFSFDTHAIMARRVCHFSFFHANGSCDTNWRGVMERVEPATIMVCTEVMSQVYYLCMNKSKPVEVSALRFLRYYMTYEIDGNRLHHDMCALYQFLFQARRLPDVVEPELSTEVPLTYLLNPWIKLMVQERKYRSPSSIMWSIMPRICDIVLATPLAMDICDSGVMYRRRRLRKAHELTVLALSLYVDRKEWTYSRCGLILSRPLLVVKKADGRTKKAADAVWSLHHFREIDSWRNG